MDICVMQNFTHMYQRLMSTDDYRQVSGCYQWLKPPVATSVHGRANVNQGWRWTKYYAIYYYYGVVASLWQCISLL